MNRHSLGNRLYTFNVHNKEEYSPQGTDSTLKIVAKVGQDSLISAASFGLVDPLIGPARESMFSESRPVNVGNYAMKRRAKYNIRTRYSTILDKYFRFCSLVALVLALRVSLCESMRGPQCMNDL